MLIGVLVIVGWISVYLMLRRMLLRTIEQLDCDLRAPLQALQNQVQSGLRMQNEPAFGIGSRANGESLSEEMENEDFDPGDGEFASMDLEDVSGLRRTLSAFAGKGFRIRSVKQIPASHGMSNAWAREGCVLVQNSHDFEIAKNRPRPAAAHAAGRQETR